MTIERLISEHAAHTPDKVALVQGDTRMTYAQLWERVNGFAAWLSARAVRGECVVVSASKNIEFVFTYFGAHLAGLVCVPIDSETNATRLRRIMDVARPALVIGELRNSDGLDVVPFGDIVAGGAEAE